MIPSPDTADEAKEIVTGGELNYIFKKNKNQNLKFKTNLYYRVRDAIIFGVGIETEALTVIFNYDINTSSFDTVKPACES